ncbi:tRNA guanosine(34) transglycosylase Tgt [Candidatus Woesearchaeota archaeon]|nr:MAG: tRNA guanosine(34) transglycosylase Tgt [Candidatus Woesearchaeota archaeon]
MFKIKKKDNSSSARLGELKTEHGNIETPFFMPVATKVTPKHVSVLDLKTIKAKAIICNAFVLYLNPGVELIRKANGVHKFMNYDDVIFTDSGGFQMLSNAFLHKVNNEGVTFKSPFDGKKKLIKPEDIMKIELDLKADVAMTLDDVPHYSKDRRYIDISMKRTHLWAERCKREHDKLKDETGIKQLLFGITQGGVFPDLRKKSAKFINSLDFDGIALGGLCLGEGRDLMFQMVDVLVPNLDENKPRYLMGVGSPIDLLEAVARGIDIFDSRFPTMSARHLSLFTNNGVVRIGKAEYKHDFNSLDPECNCYVCKNFTRAYLHYLARVKEPVAMRYFSYHNLYFIQQFIEKIKDSIKKGQFEDLRYQFMKKK